MSEALRLDSVSLRRGGRTLFDAVSLRLAPGQACALTGPNGVGKTSLLRAIAGLLPLEAGTVDFGEDRADRLHFVGHLDALKPARTAREELVFWVIWAGGSEASAMAAATTLELQPLLELEVRRLSAGQRRRLALARLIAARRPLWLLDEPMSPLDAGWRTRFGGLMQAHLDSGGLIVAAVHDPLPVAALALELAA